MPTEKKDAIQILEWAIFLYPDDANLFDRMGEFQTDGGNIEKAKYYYTQGLSIVEGQKKELPENVYKAKVKSFNERLSMLNKR